MTTGFYMLIIEAHLANKSTSHVRREWALAMSCPHTELHMNVRALPELLTCDEIGSHVCRTQIPACVTGREFCRACRGAAASPISWCVCHPALGAQPGTGIPQRCSTSPSIAMSRTPASGGGGGAWSLSPTWTRLLLRRPELLICGSRCYKWSLNLQPGREAEREELPTNQGCQGS